MGVYARTVSGQRLGKHVPVARQQILNNVSFDLNNGNRVFLRGPCRLVILKTIGATQFSSVQESAKRGLVLAAEGGIAIVGAVTRKRLVTD
jgi:drug/metabolite transporter superfamily protein YnfA